MSKYLFVLDKDRVLCDENGMPVSIAAECNEHAIPLNVGAMHDKAPTKSESQWFAMTKSHAIELGLLNAYGDRFDSVQFKSLSFMPYRQMIDRIDIGLAHTISRAIQLLLWRDDHQFCSRCGLSTTPHKHENAMICTSCGHRSYPRVQPCVIVAITRINPSSQKRQILLALHQRHKDSGMYGLIAGFVEAGESLENAVHREVAEEVNLKISNLHYINSQPWPYSTNLMLGFIADYNSGSIIVQESELVEAKFFDVDALPNIPKAGTIAHALIQQVVGLA